MFTVKNVNFLTLIYFFKQLFWATDSRHAFNLFFSSRWSARMQSHLVCMVNHTAFRWWCLSWQELNSSSVSPGPSKNGQKSPGEVCPRLPHNEGDSAPLTVPFSPEGPPAESSGDPRDCECSMDARGSLQLWLLPRASTHTLNETSLPCLLVKLSDYHLHVFSSAAHHMWEVLPVSIQKAMSLSSFVPHLTTLLYFPQGDKTDTFACLPEKCFIPPQYVIVQLLPFIFRLEISWIREWCLAWTVGFIVNVPIYCIWY